MTVKIPTPVLDEKRTAHYIDLNGGQHADVKEDVNLYFTTKWRGKDVSVCMNAGKYTTIDGELTSWRIYAERAREYDAVSPNGIPGLDVTDTARVALGEACKPLVEAWLASDAFRVSRRESFATRIKRMLQTRYYDSSAPARRALDVHGMELAHVDACHLRGLCDALDAFTALLEAPLPSSVAKSA